MAKQIFLKGHPLEFTLDVDAVIRACFAKLQRRIAAGHDGNVIHCNFDTKIHYSRTQHNYIITLQFADNYNTRVVVDEFTDENVFDSKEYNEALIKIKDNIRKRLEIADDRPNKADLISSVLTTSSQAEFSDPEAARVYIQRRFDKCNVAEFFAYSDSLADCEFDYKMCRQLLALNPPRVINVNPNHNRIPTQFISDNDYIDCNPKHEPTEFIITKMLEKDPYYILTGVNERTADDLRKIGSTYNHFVLKYLLHDYLDLFKVELLPSPKEVVDITLPKLYYDTIPQALRPYSEEL